MDVTEAGSNGEGGTELAQRLNGIPDVLGLRVQGSVVDASVVDAILFPARDALATQRTAW